VNALVVSFSNADHLWAGLEGSTTAPAVVWKSTNGGGSWSPTSGINGRLINDLLIHFANPSIMLASTTAGASPGIYRSTDGGATWGLVSGTQSYDLTAQLSAPDVILAGSWNGVSRSTDAGLTWSPGQPFQGNYQVAFAPSDANRAYTARDAVLLKSTNAGISFTDVASVPQLLAIQAIAVHPLFPDQILVAGRVVCNVYDITASVYKSTNAGSTWTLVYTDPLCPSGQPSELVYDPIDPNHVYLGQNWGRGTGFTHSSSGGASGTWIKKVNGIRNYAIQQVEGDLFGTNYAQYEGDFYRSLNNLAIWTALPSNGFTISESNLEVNLTTPNRLWDFGQMVEEGDFAHIYLHRSTNSGLSWTPLGGVPTGFPNTGAPFRAFTNHGDGTHVYVPADPVVGTEGLYRSSDAGVSYTLVNASPFFRSTRIVVDPTDGLRLFVNGTGATPPIRLSEDGGVTFSARDSGLPPASTPNPISGLFMRRSDPDQLEVVYRNGQVWETFDGGLSWSLRFSLNVGGAAVLDATWDEATGHVFLATVDAGVISSHPLYDPAGLPTLDVYSVHWDAAQSVLLAGTYSAGLWHQQIASPVDAPVVAQTSPFAIVVSPNPARDFTQAEFGIPAGGARVTGNVFDASGRLVRKLIDADLPAGQRRLLWDGRADSGERATTGIYFVRIRAGASEGTAKIVRLD